MPTTLRPRPRGTRTATPSDITTRCHGISPTAVERPYSDKVAAFLDEARETPFLVVDLDIVGERYDALRLALRRAEVFYAVKANPAEEILRLLVEKGASFDVASPAEIAMVLAAGATPDRISYGNTIKKQRDIAAAYAQGVRLFAFDSEAELAKLIASAPGSTVFCRVLCDGTGADWPLSRKFGCEPEEAQRLILLAADAGFDVGISFHVGSQQRDVHAWDGALAEVARIVSHLHDDGVRLSVVNIGGGFPGTYLDPMRPVGNYGMAINAAIERRLAPWYGDPDGPSFPRIIAEPGRYMVADAGVLATEVVLVSRKHVLDDRRWVYLDCGKFGGLAETMDEAIRYRLRTPHDGRPGQRIADGPVTIAGPTCDSADVLYEKTDYRLPLALDAGDRVEVLSAGAYTTTYAAVGFNGFAPLRSYCI